MTEEALFLEAVAESPDDDAPRLIYADWLSEQTNEHQLARAEFIRTQIALASAEEWSAERYALQATERALLDRHQRVWEAPLVALGAWNIGYRRGLPASCEIKPGVLVERREEVSRAAPTIERVHLRYGQGDGDVHTAAFERAFTPRLIELDLSQNHISDFDVDVSAIVSSPWLADLQSLSLAVNFFSGGAITELLNALAKGAFRSLDVSENGLNIDAGREIAKSPALPRLASLNLSGNPLQGSIRSLLAACHAGALDALSLSRMQFDEPLDQSLDAVLPTSLRTLDLSRNPLDVRAAKWLGEYSAGRAYRRLDLSRTKLGGAGLRALIESFQGESIDALNLGGNELTDRDAAALAEWPIVAGLRSLDLSSNQFTNASAQAFANEPRFAALRELNLSRNRIGQPGMSALKASAYLAGVQRLDLSENTPSEFYRG